MASQGHIIIKEYQSSFIPAKDDGFTVYKYPTNLRCRSICAFVSKAALQSGQIWLYFVTVEPDSCDIAGYRAIGGYNCYKTV